MSGWDVGCGHWNVGTAQGWLGVPVPIPRYEPYGLQLMFQVAGADQTASGSLWIASPFSVACIYEG
jgi:hypothetical protein